MMKYKFATTDKVIMNTRIYHPYTILGPATEVWKASAVKRLLGGWEEVYLGLIVKMGWLRESEMIEVDFIREARSVRSIANNIVKVFASGVGIDDSAAERFVHSLGLDPTILRAPLFILMEEYRPIWELHDDDGAMKFWDVVAQLFRCLHTLYSERGILHRDISIGNVCFIMDGDKAVCKLIDFDRAVHVGSPASRPKHLSKATPFRACEVHDQNTKAYVPRLYHDFESILYMAVWYAFGFTLQKLPDSEHTIYGWGAGSWTDILNDKAIFLDNTTHAEKVFSELSNEIHTVKCKFLWSNFHVAHLENIRRQAVYKAEKDRVPKDELAPWDEEHPEPGYSEYATFPEIMVALKEKVEPCNKDCCLRPEIPELYRVR